ncbi:MAG: metalloregulator ArsR/SmtB family transcription factor [Corynebacterium sp.]|nr:metalloregulator ArsR/SmtB family transcription factor [Corynebacterium sp.]
MAGSMPPEDADNFPRPESSYQELASFAMALSSPIRIKIIDLLSRGDLAVQELVARLDASQPLVSQHLRVLRRAGIVVADRSGRQRVYHLQSVEMQGIVNLLQPTANQAAKFADSQATSSTF